MRFLISELPFALTGKQKVVLFQILKDMEGDFAMNRLLQGDVGTGKTAVALLASLHAMLGSPIQTAFMVPTEILAEQHFRNLAPAFEKHGMLAACLVGSMTRREKEEVKTGLANGSIRFVVGTHALISEDVIFHNLGFVVIDEQHRFGVEQRKILEQNVRYSYRVPHTIQSVLSDENSDSSVNSLPPAERLSPHVLYMTATPIPRTLAITLHGDQDVSILDEYPAGRLPILTKVVRENARHEAYNFIDAEIRS
jgi:ATP-dependent DNA helicase RecG